MSELKKKTINGVLWSSIERFSVQGVQFCFGIVMARLLSPSDYGIIAMLTIFMALSQTFIDSGFSNALIRKQDRNEKDYATAFYFNIGVGLICYLLLCLGAPAIALFYNTPILTNLTKVVGLTLLFNSLCVVQQAKLTAEINFKTQAKVSLAAVILSGGIGIILAYKGFGVWALALQSVLSSFFRMLFLWIWAQWKPSEHFCKESFRALFNYGSKLLASGLLDTIYRNLYTIVIGKFFSGSALGFYSRADQFAQFPSSNITGVLQRVTFPVLSSIQHEDDRLKVNYRKFLKLSAFIVFPLMVGLAAVAEPFINLLLTEKWSGAILILQILCFAMMWYPIHAINLNLLQVKGRSDLFLRLEIIKKSVITVILCITIPMGLTAMCIGQVINSLIALVINTHYTGKLIQVGFSVQMRDLFPTLLNSLIMGAICFVTSQFIAGSLLQLIVGLLIGATYYIASNWFMKSNELKELTSLIKRK